MFKAGDIIKVVDFSSNYPNTPLFQLDDDHPYRKLGEGTCIVESTHSRNHTSIRNLENGEYNSIFTWRCVLAKSLVPDWEV
jgi:hypothetical protein